MSQRDIIVAKIKAQLDGWNRTLDKLEANTENIATNNRDRYRATLQDIRDQVQQLEKKCMVLKNSTTDAWQDLMAGNELAWREFEDGAKSSLKKITGIDF